MSESTPSLRRPLEAAFYAGDRVLACCVIRRGRYVIGHEPKNEIIVDEPSVSGRHARLSVHSDDEIYIEDLGSANGTRVDGQLVTEPTRVSFHSEVRLGAVPLRFERSRLPAAVFEELPPTFLHPQRYEIEEVVVQGTKSVIHQARDLSLQREVAIKLMMPEVQRDTAAVLRFIREAQVTGQLPHPGILPIYEFGQNEQGLLYFTTRFIEGESLSTILERLAEGDERALARYSLFTLIQLWQKICDAVAFAHSRGVVHNALRPDFIEVGRFGEVFVTQWSHAILLTETFGDVRHVNAPENSLPLPLTHYSAPEQAAGLVHEMDTRADIFALGGLLYRIVTLRDPLSGETEDGLLEAALNASVPAPAAKAKSDPCPHWPKGRLPEFPAAVAMKALSYQREDRHQTVEELQREVATWQEGASVGGQTVALWKQFPTLRRQR
jgi:serine/threonine protein kinase